MRRVEHEREPELRLLFGKVKGTRRGAPTISRSVPSIEIAAADDGGIRPERVRPEVLRYQRDRRRTRRRVCVAESASVGRRDAQHPKHTRRRERGEDALRGVRRARRRRAGVHVDGGRAVDPDVGEHAVGTPIQQVGCIGLIHVHAAADLERM